MNDEIRKSRTIKIKPSVLRKTHITAIESQKRLGEWIEEAIEEKVVRERRRNSKNVERKGLVAGLSGEVTISGIV